MTLQASRESRNLKPVPTKLAQLIAFANLVAPDVELADLERDLHEHVEALWDEESPSDEWMKNWQAGAASVLTRRLKMLPDAFRNWLLPASLSIGETHHVTNYGRYTAVQQSESKTSVSLILHVIDRYSLVREVREALRALARWGARVRAAQEEGLPPDFPFKERPIKVKVEATIYVDKEGTARAGKDTFADAVDDVDATRIRECWVCKCIFWAGRIDSECCGARCADIRRKRLFRWRDAVKKSADKRRRKENTKYKKKVLLRRTQLGAPATAKEQREWARPGSTSSK
jgi:hypothetical protein